MTSNRFANEYTRPREHTPTREVAKCGKEYTRVLASKSSTAALSICSLVLTHSVSPSLLGCCMKSHSSLQKFSRPHGKGVEVLLRLVRQSLKPDRLYSNLRVSFLTFPLLEPILMLKKWIDFFLGKKWMSFNWSEILLIFLPIFDVITCLFASSLPNITTEMENYHWKGKRGNTKFYGPKRF